MSLKENLSSKVELDQLLQKLISKVKEPPAAEWIDLPLVKKLLHQTDFHPQEIRTLNLYVRPFDGQIKEILVFDMGLPIYHTTVADVALRKNSFWQEIFDLRNIKKIMFDRDVLVSRGKESLKRLHTVALSLLDLTYNSEDLAIFMDEAQQGLQKKSMRLLGESFNLIFDLLGFEAVSLGLPGNDYELYARSNSSNGAEPIYEHLILFSEERWSLGLKKGSFSPKNNLDLAWINQYVQGKRSADLQDIGVFDFLSKLAQEKKRFKKRV